MHKTDTNDQGFEIPSERIPIAMSIALLIAAAACCILVYLKKTAHNSGPNRVIVTWGTDPEESEIVSIDRTIREELEKHYRP
jgi:hypothetical protein